VATGTDALLRIKEIKPDVLIADVAVPGIDGYSLCEIVRNEADLAGMKSILTGEEGTVVDNTRVEAAASDGYLAKPFNAEKLLVHLGLKTPAGEEMEEEAEVPDEGAFQMDVSDDMSFADVALSEEQRADGEFVVEETEAQEEAAEDADETERKPESLDSILGLSDDEPGEQVDVDLGGDEEEEAVPLQIADSPAPVGPFDMTEAPVAEERGGLADEEPGGAVDTGSVAGDMASEEGRQLVEEIVKRLSDKVVREVAWEVVPELAERIIKETLEKITK
jgi:CheY-like chemotaxis protein